VLVWEAGALPAQGALIVEGLNRIVGTLNRKTRSATCPLGGSDGGYTAQQVMTWLSGLPLRTRAGPAGLEHEPVRFATDRLVADRAVDGLLWVSSFDPTRLPPADDLPRVVMGPPAMAEPLRAAGGLDQAVFMPVATPGINAAGHLFRTDLIVVVPLQSVRDDALPGVAELVTQIGAGLGAFPS
jgi:formylmethanofuran dehydrogenase subunit B